MESASFPNRRRRKATTVPKPSLRVHGQRYRMRHAANAELLETRSITTLVRYSAVSQRRGLPSAS